jgi:hypothetical protein
VTPDSASFGEIEAFLEVDGWREIPSGERGGKRQRHIFFEKTLPDGRVLQTHISHDRSAHPNPHAFSMILREQLEVSRSAFWEALQTGKPVERPTKVEVEAVVEHEVWVVEVLTRDLHMNAKEIEELDEEKAKELVYRHWSQAKS